MNSPIEKMLSALADHDCDARQSGNGWSAPCPAHDDRNPSLSITEGEGQRALVDCKAGCDTKSVVASLGLTMSDLFSDRPSTSTQSRQTRGKRQNRRQDKAKPRGIAFTTSSEAVAALDAMMAKQQGRRTDYWHYRDAESNEVAVMVRYDVPTPKGEKQRKEFRPVSRHDAQWFIKGMREPRPLYRLPDLASANRVYVVEGEKAADAARSIGLTATTSAHGAKSPDKTDWTP